jgi:hypothetical protein
MADAIVRYLPGKVVVKYILDDDSEEPLPVSVGKKLHKANVDSLIARYGEEYKDCVFKYVCAKKTYTIPELTIAVRSFNYQSCEVPNYDSTDTWKLIDELRAVLGSKLSEHDRNKLELGEHVDTWNIKDDSTDYRYKPAKPTLNHKKK